MERRGGIDVADREIKIPKTNDMTAAENFDE